MKLAVIREADCVGCAKCIPACPVDAIIGAPKFLHTVFTDQCIGCGLCVAPCPTDCIDMVDSNIKEGSIEKTKLAANAKLRYQNRTLRLKEAQPKLLPNLDPIYKTQIRQDIKAAFERVAKKRKIEAMKN